jgi:hypothetical protein
MGIFHFNNIQERILDNSASQIEDTVDDDI